MNKVLMFDLGGVLVMNDMFEELPKLLQHHWDDNELKTRWLTSPAVREFELGLCTPDVFAQTMVKEFELSIGATEFINAFTGWPKGFYSGAETLLRKLRAQHLTACLSNSNELHWTTPVTSHFNHAYSSHLLHRIKPDVEVFEFVTSDMGCKPDEIVFFDDSQLNVDAALAFGWEAHLTVGYAELLRVLENKEFSL